MAAPNVGKGLPRRRRAALTTESATRGLAVARLSVAAEQVVFVKGVVEASDGLACVFAERGGDLHIASPQDRRAELCELLMDLSTELGGTLQMDTPPPEAPSPSSAPR